MCEALNFALFSIQRNVLSFMYITLHLISFFLNLDILSNVIVICLYLKNRTLYDSRLLYFSFFVLCLLYFKLRVHKIKQGQCQNLNFYLIIFYFQFIVVFHYLCKENVILP